MSASSWFRYRSRSWSMPCLLAALAVGGLVTDARALPAMPGAASAPKPAAVDLPDARWSGPGIELEVGLARDASGAPDEAAPVRAETTNPFVHYAIGIVGLPLAALSPPVALGLPVYVVVAPPLQAVFNARARALAAALQAEPLPERVVEAFAAQWTAPPAGPGDGDGAAAPRQVRVRISGYGFATRSRQPLGALATQEPLCLVARLQVELRTPSAGGAPTAVTQDWPLERDERVDGAPPTPCESLGTWARDDARLARQSLRELAEVVAALLRRELARGP